ncbi:MAG: hypothetical protein QM784_10325 [Polyangiaceae bacterium]
MAQRHKPRFEFEPPNYPRLSVLSIAAALTACVGGQIDNSGDPGEVGGNAGSGGQSSTVVNPAGGLGTPFGGAAATSRTSTAGQGGNDVPQTKVEPTPSGGAPLSFGGTTSTIPQEIGGEAGAGGVQSVGGTGNVGIGGSAPETTSVESGGAAGAPSTTSLPELTGTAPLAFQAIENRSSAEDSTVTASVSIGTTPDPFGTTGSVLLSATDTPSTS